MERILTLSDFNIDYSSFENKFKDLAKLAASVAGTEISLVGMIDSYTQWIISSHGMDIEQSPREETVCQYTILEDDHMEVEDLSNDARFKDKEYVTQDPKLRYYYGLPLKANGVNIGTLCLIDRTVKKLSPEKEELLKIIAVEIVDRLKTYQIIESLRTKVKEANTTKNKVAHDIRGPLGGIIGLAQIIAEQGKENNMDEVLEFINLIHKSGKSILDLADEILSAEFKAETPVKSDELNLKLFKEKLEKLYTAQARTKEIDFQVNVSPETDKVPFPKNKLLQITGNLISNALKFTPNNGMVHVSLVLTKDQTSNELKITVKDSGSGLTPGQIGHILGGTATSTDGTAGEQGYGFGLALVKHLIDSLKGTLAITSDGNGALFEVTLPQ